MNKILINFTLCIPAPSDGYNIMYRVAGSSDSYTNAGNFFISPAIFYDTINPAGTCYEGFIQTVCGDVLGNPVFWESCGSGAAPATKNILVLNASLNDIDVKVDAVTMFLLFGYVQEFVFVSSSEITVTGVDSLYRVRFWTVYNSVLYSELTALNGMVAYAPVDLTNVNYISIEPV